MSVPASTIEKELRMRPCIVSATLVLTLLMLMSGATSAADSPQSVNAVMRPAAQLRESTEKSILEWIRTHGHALPATDPTAADLRSLASALDAPRVIGIGEITHGTHEDLAVKSALIKALIERGDIDCLVFELNRRVGERLQRFVAPGSTETDPVAAIREAPVYTVWHTHELAELLDWIRGWNAGAAHPVRIVGVDVQDVSHDLDDALHRLKAIDVDSEAQLRRRLSDWLGDTALNQHPGTTVANLDRSRWLEAMEATIALEAALEGRDAIGLDAARAAHAGLAMLEYRAKGVVQSPSDIPAEVWSRRDVSMADRLLAAVPQGEHAILWAHDAHVARQDKPYGLGFTSMGSRLHRALGREDYRVVTFSARRLDFNSKGMVEFGETGGDPARSFSVWRYDSGPSDFGTFLSKAGMAQYWIDLDELPASDAGMVFRSLDYGRPIFGWAMSNPPSPVLPAPVGFRSDIIIHYDAMTPSRRLPAVH